MASDGFVGSLKSGNSCRSTEAEARAERSAQPEVYGKVTVLRGRLEALQNMALAISKQLSPVLRDVAPVADEGLAAARPIASTPLARDLQELEELGSSIQGTLEDILVRIEV